jgi:hypothetical protein
VSLLRVPTHGKEHVDASDEYVNEAEKDLQSRKRRYCAGHRNHSETSVCAFLAHLSLCNHYRCTNRKQSDGSVELIPIVRPQNGALVKFITALTMFSQDKRDRCTLQNRKVQGGLLRGEIALADKLTPLAQATE